MGGCRGCPTLGVRREACFRSIVADKEREADRLNLAVFAKAQFVAKEFGTMSEGRLLGQQRSLFKLAL